MTTGRWMGKIVYKSLYEEEYLQRKECVVEEKPQGTNTSRQEPDKRRRTRNWMESESWPHRSNPTNSPMSRLMGLLC